MFARLANQTHTVTLVLLVFLFLQGFCVVILVKVRRFKDDKVINHLFIIVNPLSIHILRLSGELALPQVLLGDKEISGWNARDASRQVPLARDIIFKGCTTEAIQTESLLALSLIALLDDADQLVTLRAEPFFLGPPTKVNDKVRRSNPQALCDAE